MIDILRKKFIRAAMVSLALVLLLILGSVNLISYRKTIADADMILMLLSENQGVFPKHMFPDKGPAPERQREDGRRFSPETPYESRFFTVTLSEDGSPARTDTANIAAVDMAAAQDYARKAAESGKTKGFLGDYRFYVDRQSQLVRVLFLDCGRSLAGFRTTALASFGIAAAGLAGVFVLLLFISRRVVKPVADSYEKQRRFITDAGHEIKTPITIINADADLVEMECGENEWLEDIRKQAKRLADLTNDLVYLSRMDEAKPAAMFVEFPLSDVVEEAAQSFLAPAKQQGKELVMEIQELLSLNGNEKEIRQLVSILLDNAMKYSPENSTVRLSLKKEPRAIVLSVENQTKEQINKNQLPNIFERFYRLDSSRNSETGGYGLGLAIAKGIVASHHGKIRAEATGEFTICLSAAFPG